MLAWDIGTDIAFRNDSERTFTQIFNPLMGTGNYSATSNNMKLVYTGR